MADDSGDPKVQGLGALREVMKRLGEQSRAVPRFTVPKIETPFTKLLSRDGNVTKLFEGPPPVERWTMPTALVDAQRHFESTQKRLEAEREQERIAKEKEREAVQESAAALRELASATRAQTRLAWKVGIVSAVIGATAGVVLTVLVQRFISPAAPAAAPLETVGQQPTEAPATTPAVPDAHLLRSHAE